ncbi:MAG: AzlD domain-containing protein [Treponemataceae bacterium]
MLSVETAFIAVLVMAFIILSCRAAPFLLFARRKAPAALSFVEKYMPPVAMTVLAVSSYASLNWAARPHGLPETAAGVFVVLAHLWKRNALLSIFGGTAFYMLLRSFLE